MLIMFCLSHFQFLLQPLIVRLHFLDAVNHTLAGKKCPFIFFNSFNKVLDSARLKFVVNGQPNILPLTKIRIEIVTNFCYADFQQS